MLFFFTLPWALLFPAPALGAGAAVRRVVIVVIGGTDLQQWQAQGLPNLRHLLRIGSLGLMNSVTAGPFNDGAEAATIGASAHLHAPPRSTLLGVRERVGGADAGSLYAQRTGRTSPLHGLVDPWIAQLRAANAQLPYPLTVGALGTAIVRSGRLTAAVGNADRPHNGGTALDRSAATISMTEHGIVPIGDVSGNLLVSASRAPCGVQLRPGALLRASLAALGRNPALTVIDYGDTERAALCGNGSAQATRSALLHFDSFLGQLLPHLSLRHTLLLLVSPTPTPAMVAGERLMMPILVVGPGYGAGYLTSPTTHRQGIVANIDIAPTVLAALGIARPADFFGQPMLTVPGRNAPSLLAAQALRLSLLTRERLHVAPDLVYFIAGALLLALFVLWRRRRSRLTGVALYLLGAVLSLPLATLLAGAVPAATLGDYAIILSTVTALLAAAALVAARSPLDPLIWPPALFCLLLITDTALGQHLALNSLMAPDPQVGARYYGIGNEYMGLLLGSAAIGFPALRDRFRLQAWPRPATVLAYLAILIVLVLPGLGTKAGGAITATAMFAYIVLRLAGHRVTARDIAWIGGGILALLALLVAYDVLAHTAAQRTDIGRAGLLIFHGGPAQAAYIIGRKLLTNISGIATSFWALLGGTAVGLLVTLRSRSQGALRNLGGRWPDLAAGLSGAVVGMVVAFIFNDTGYVASAMLAVPVMAAIVHLDLQAARDANGPGSES